MRRLYSGWDARIFAAVATASPGTNSRPGRTMRPSTPVTVRIRYRSPATRAAFWTESIRHLLLGSKRLHHIDTRRASRRDERREQGGEDEDHRRDDHGQGSRPTHHLEIGGSGQGELEADRGAGSDSDRDDDQALL